MNKTKGFSKIQILLAISFAVSCLVFHIKDKELAVERAISEVKMEVEKSHQKAWKDASALAKEKEKKLEASKLLIQKDKDEKIKQLNFDLQLALDSLRNRPDRASVNSLPDDTGNSKTCTGRELFKEDAEFLAREAARADEVVVERDFYFNQYEAARKAINETPK